MECRVIKPENGIYECQFTPETTGFLKINLFNGGNFCVFIGGDKNTLLFNACIVSDKYKSSEINIPITNVNETLVIKNNKPITVNFESAKK